MAYRVWLTVRTGTTDDGLPIRETYVEEVHGTDASDALKAAKAAEKRWAVRVDKVVPGPTDVHPDQQEMTFPEEWDPPENFDPGTGEVEPEEVDGDDE